MKYFAQALYAAGLAALLAMPGHAGSLDCITLNTPPTLDGGILDTGVLMDGGGATSCGDPTWADFWFDGTDPAGTGTPPAEGALATWVNKGTDSSVADLDGAGTQQPIFRSAGYVDFDGVNDTMTASEATSNYPWVKGSNCSGCSFWHGFVAQRHGTTGLMTIYGGPLSSPNATFYYNNLDTHFNTLDTPSACGNTILGVTSAGAWQAHSAGFVPADTGTECKEQFDGTSTAHAKSGDPPATNPGGVLRVSDSTYTLDGYIYQAVSMNAPTSAEVATAEAWLVCKAAEAAGL